jgi:hypothetical protein
MSGVYSFSDQSIEKVDNTIILKFKYTNVYLETSKLSINTYHDSWIMNIQFSRLYIF